MKKLLAKIRKILHDRRTRRFLTRFVSGVAALVVFVTTYALVLPAITMEKEANCGIEAHQHDDSCYTEELICDIPESDGHHHDESCYSTTSALVCETEEHEHSAENGCYDDEGNLICEVMEHRHNEECYEEVRELTCQIPESEGHHHTEDCYEKVLTCGKEVHVHSTACYEDDPVSDAAVAASTSSAAAATTSAGSVSSAGMTLNFEGDIDKVVDFDETVETDKTDDIGFVDNSGSDETNRSSETTGTSEIASSSETNKEVASGSEVTYGRENAGTGRTETSNTALTNADNNATALTSSADTDQYIPQLDAVDFNTALNNHTGIYYYRAADEDIVEDSSAIPAEDWNRIPNNIDRINDDMDDVDLGNKDLLRVYLSYTIPAGSLNATNPVARYRLPSNLHLTDPQVKAINENVNGLAGQYVDMSNLEITDPDKYNAYLGVEAVEGTRRPDEAVEDYLAEQARKAGKDADDVTEYISAVVRVENVYDADGLYGEKDAYLGQDLIFTFAPYSIEKNQHEYESTGKPTRAGEEIKGWFTFDLNMGQVDFEEPEITTSTAEEASNIEDNVDGDSESSHSEDENTEEKHIENVQTEDDHNGDDLIKEDSIEDGHKDESNEENHSVNNTTVDVNTADNESSEDGKADDNQDHAVTIERAERTAEIIFVEEEWDGKDKKTDQISTTLTAVEETVLEAQNDDKLEDDEDLSVSGEKERSAEENEGALSDEKAADGNVKDPVDTEQVIMPAMSFNDSIKVSTGKPVGIDENAGSFLANAAESLPEEAEVSVRVEADEGTFPAGTTMVLSAVDQSSYDTLAETLAETVESGDALDTDTSDTDTSEAKANGQQAETVNTEDQKINRNTEQNNADNNTNIKTYGFQAVDITFFDKDGNEIEPAKPVRVALTSKAVEQAREKAEESAIADPVVVHVDNEGKAEQMDLVSPEEVEPAKGRSEEEMLEEAEKTAESGKTDNANNDISADDASGKKDVEHKADAVDESASAVSRDIDEAEESATEGITAQQDTTAVEENEESADTAEFTADSFSVYAIVYTVELYTNVITDSGETYRISVTYDETSGIPQDAELKVKEIKKGDKGYEDYYTEAVKAASESSDAQNDASNNNASDKDNKRVNPDKTYARFFDIEIWANGEKIEPTGDVSVSIRLLDVPETDDENVIKIVHFAQDDIEVIPHTIAADHVESVDTAKDQDDEQAENNVHSEMEFNFTASSFSVYSVVSYTVDFHWEVDGKQYEFSLPGGGFVSFTKLMEVLSIADNEEQNNSEESQADAQDTEEKQYAPALTLDSVQVRESTKKFVEDVEKVEFTSPELLWVEKVDSSSTVGELKEANELDCEYSAELTEEQINQINAMEIDGGDWALISLKEFDTVETLTVTMKDQSVFTIKVTDAQDPSVFLGKEVIIYDNQEKRAMTSNWDNNNRPELQSIAEGEADGIDSAHWMLEYDGNQQGYYLKAKNGKYLYLTDNDIRLMDYRYQATLLNIQPGGNPDYYITAKNNGNYVLTYCDDAQYDGYFCARNGGYNGANTRNWLYIREAAPVVDPVGDWLLYFDDDFDEVTIHVGETITLRPYDRWEWKEGNADVQSKHWNIDGRDDNYWNQIDSNDGNGAHKETWSSGGSNGVAGFDWTAYVKKDTELVTHYWSVQGRATAVGDYTLTNTKNGKTITVHVVEGEPTTTPDPITNTVDFAVNLFDYDKNGTLDPSGNTNLANNGNNKTDSTNAMNGSSEFYFLSSGSGNNGAKSWNKYTSGAANPGIVKSTLDSDGYPQLKGRGQNSQSLKYLFDTSKQQWNGGKISDTVHYPDGMIAYPNVNGMFQKDDDGYYYFNSNTNYFYYNTETGESKLYQHTYTQTSSADKHSLVNDKPIGFFPFHDYEATDNLYVNQNSNLNHHLGMSMEIPFRMKADRKDANGNDIKFEFTGDDDLWVFAEWEDANGQKQSKLLLDIGGIHQPVYGAIDFTHDTSTSLDENETMGLQPGVDYTLKVFYLERGGCDSNLAVRFNLPLTERGDIPFTKRDCLTNDPLPGAVFGLYTDEDCTQRLRQATSDNEGHVLFTNVGIGTYYMKEITPPAGYNASTAVYRVDVKSKKKAEITLINGADAPSDYSYNVDNRPIMLTVKKAWIPTSAADTANPVYFKLYKKGNSDTEIRNSDYGYVNNQGYKLDRSNSWTATFRNLSQGQYYVVESSVPNGYTVMYAVGEDISAENLKETAKDASTDQNGNLTILNRQNKMDIGVEKTWEGIDPTDSSLEGANITVTLKRYKLVDILGTLKVTTNIINSGDPAYDFSATYQVIDSAGKVVKEFTTTESAEQMFNDIPVGTYTVTETLAVPDPDLGYAITHDPALGSGAVSHSKTVMVTKNHTEENPALAAFESSYTPKVGQLTITKTVNGAPNGYSFDATYTVKRGDTVIGTYSYSELSKTLTLPEGNYTVIESNVSADPEHHLSQHSSQTLNNIQVREGSPQTAKFTTTYTPANPVYVTAVYFQNRTNQYNRRTDVNRELFYGGQTILICWRQKNNQTNGNVLYINGSWYKGYGNPNYREVEYVLPESGGDVLIEISDTWWPNGIDGKITVKLKEENPDPEPAQSMSNGPMMMSASGRKSTPARTASTVTQDNTVTPPSVPAEFMDSKIYVIDDDYTQTVDLTQNGNWKKTDISVDPVDEDGYPYHYFISNVTETGIEGRVTVTIDDKLVNKDNKDTLKLSLKNKVEKNGALELTKKVAGTGADEEKAFEFTIALTAPEGQTLADSYTFKKNGNVADGITYTRDASDPAKATVTGISLKHNDVFTIEDLPAGTTYKITEGNYSSEGYSSSLPAAGLEGTITGGNTEKESVTVTNTLSAGSLTVEKTLEGNAIDDQKDFTFSVTFNKARLNGIAGSYKTGKSEDIVTATPANITFASGEATVSFTLKGGEIAQFTDIPVGTTFTVSETSKDTNGYETSVSSTGGTVNSVEKTVTGSISATAAVTASYVNKKNKLEAEAVKQWKSGTQTITWPADVEKVAFTLYKTVNGNTTLVTRADLTDYATAEQIAAFQNPIEITSSTEGKKATWNNLPSKYWLAANPNTSPAVEAGWYEATYSVKETKIFYTDGTEKDVNVAATEGVITNEVEKVRIHASKKWKDKNGVELDGTEGKEIPIGAQVTYTLVKDGTEVPAHAVILNGVDETKDPVSGGEITPQNTDYEGAGWTAWFTELPKYNDNGTLVIYSVKETGKWTGYEIEGSDSVGDEGTIYNKESSIDINILKVDKQNNKPLTGATFVLRRYDEGYHQVLETWDAQQVSAEAGKEGTLTFEKLQVGWYELEETISPTGYVKTTSNPRFTVTADQEGNLAVTFINSEMVTYDSTVQTFTVKNEPGAALPSTGGPGTTALYLLGIMLTGFAGAGLVMRKRRRDAA